MKTKIDFEEEHAERIVARVASLQSEIDQLNKALALKLDALPSGLNAGQSMKFEQLLKEAHSLLNDKAIVWKFGPGPWRDRRDAWNKAVEKVKGGQ